MDWSLKEKQTAEWHKEVNSIESNKEIEILKKA